MSNKPNMVQHNPYFTATGVEAVLEYQRLEREVIEKAIALRSAVRDNDTAKRNESEYHLNHVTAEENLLEAVDALLTERGEK